MKVGDKVKNKNPEAYAEGELIYLSKRVAVMAFFDSQHTWSYKPEDLIVIE